MKTLPAPGVVAIVNPQSPRTSRPVAHDPWPQHAVSYDGTGITVGTGSGVALVFFFTLLDGNRYGYYSKFFPDLNHALNQYPPLTTYVSPEGLVGNFGLWFNYVVRPTLANKYLA